VLLFRTSKVRLERALKVANVRNLSICTSVQTLLYKYEHFVKYLVNNNGSAQKGASRTYMTDNRLPKLEVNIKSDSPSNQVVPKGSVETKPETELRRSQRSGQITGRLQQLSTRSFELKHKILKLKEKQKKREKSSKNR
jgi:hypothetical protein